MFDKEGKQFFDLLSNRNSKIPKYLPLFSIKWIFLKSKSCLPSVFACLGKAFCELLSIKAAENFRRFYNFQIECVYSNYKCVLDFFRNIRSISKISNYLSTFQSYRQYFFPQKIHSQFKKISEDFEFRVSQKVSFRRLLFDCVRSTSAWLLSQQFFVVLVPSMYIGSTCVGKIPSQKSALNTSSVPM